MSRRRMNTAAAVMATALLAVACGPATPPVATSSVVACPEGTHSVLDADHDNGWGDVERTSGCARRDGTLHGPAEEILTAGRNPIRLVGRYADGKRVGTWTHYDAKTGAKLGSFTLDQNGTGVEVIRDVEGHSRSGTVVSGRREGEWTYHDVGGAVVASEAWAGGKLVGRHGSPPWQPPMIEDDRRSGSDHPPAR